MANFLVSDDRYRELIYDDDRGSHRSDRGETPGAYRFARAHGKPAHGPLGRVSGTFRRMVEAIAESKLRRMERELELRGIPTRDNPRHQNAGHRSARKEWKQATQRPPFTIHVPV
jgi:hypothetical protein